MNDFVKGGPPRGKISPELVKHLPFKQRKAVEFGEKLAPLLRMYGDVYFRFDDAVLATDLSDVLLKAGLSPRPQPDQAVKVLIHNMIKWLNGGHLVLLHFKPKFSDFNLVNLLREVKLAAPAVNFKGFIPVFVGKVSSQKQMDLFRMLGSFGIRYGCFLTPNGGNEKNIEEVLESLDKFREIVAAEISASRQLTPADIDKEDVPEKVRTYKKLLAEGDAAMREGRYEEAIKSFSDALALGPNFQALMERGEAYYKSADYASALADFRQAADLEKSAPGPYAKIGACCFEMVKDAVKKRDPVKARQWFALGLKNLNEVDGIVQRMAEDARATPEKLPPFPYAPVLAALAESDLRGMGLDDLQDQLDRFAAGVLQKTKAQEDAISDNSADTRIDRAILLARYMQYEEAEKIFRQVVAEDPANSGPAFNNFAVELRKNGQFQKAFEIYLELLGAPIPDREIVVENMKLAGLKLTAHMKEHMRHDEAVEVYRRVLDFKPRGREWVLCELAMTLLEIQDQARASFAFMEALYINPKLMENEKFAPFKDLESLRREMMKKLQESEPGQKIR